MTVAPTTPLSSPVPPLGVHLTQDGATVAVFASHASGVDLCLLDRIPESSAEYKDNDDLYVEQRIPLSKNSFGVWHDFVPGIRAGQLYGFRVHGEWRPHTGLRHNPAKLLMDPYARGVVGRLQYGDETYGYVRAGEDSPNPYGAADPRDSRDHVPHAVVVDPPASLEQARPHVPWANTVIYEAHVQGLTQLRHDIPEELRGTYAALSHPELIAHYKKLGITTLELLPIHAFVSEPHLIDKNLTNYWGYNTLSFFAPHEGYATEHAQRQGAAAVHEELKNTIRTLHEHDIEVILDVVYNHTCEGGLDGQHLSFRGFDNTVYYLHDGGLPAHYADVTGCGNTLDFRRPRVIQLALDSMRYWITEFGVDGFRLDLAATLGRDSEGFNPNHPFLVALQTDPVLAQAKIIAEPWDVGPGGWQTGQFPCPITEWNDRYRNAVRDFWLSDAQSASHGQPGSGIREFATRLAGSVDLFGHSDPPLMRGPLASINFVTAHDGFTLADLVAYNHKHNDANGEESRDGTNDNRSWNHGVEGALHHEDPWHVIAPMRRRSIRNLLATLLFSTGVPMLTAGDELGRTQHGNNNAYCQNNPTSWLHWQLNDWRTHLLETTAFLLTLRRELPALHVDTFFTGQPLPHDEDHQPDLAWYGQEGRRLTVEQWNDPHTRIFQMFRRGRLAEHTKTPDPHVLLVFNGTLNPAVVTLPIDDNSTRQWSLTWDSEWEIPAKETSPHTLGGGTLITVEALSIQVYVAQANPS